MAMAMEMEIAIDSVSAYIDGWMDGRMDARIRCNAMMLPESNISSPGVALCFVHGIGDLYNTSIL